MDHRYRHSRFLLSVDALRQLPVDRGLEVAFAGRSNAGKSSALNLLTGQRNLARTSKTPGRTQLLNFFEITTERYLVDLPGYGYAKVPEVRRRHWHELVQRYLSERRSLVGLVLVMDVRHPVTERDRLLLEWGADRGLAVHALLTKADKLRRGAAAATLHQVRDALASYPQTSVQLFSALNGSGLEQLRHQLDNWLFAETATS